MTLQKTFNALKRLPFNQLLDIETDIEEWDYHPTVYRILNHECLAAPIEDPIQRRIFFATLRKHGWTFKDAKAAYIAKYIRA